MTIDLTCPVCQRVFKDLPETLIGKKVKCSCGASISVAQPEPPTAAPPAVKRPENENPPVPAKLHADLESEASSDFYGLHIARIFIFIFGLLFIFVGAIQGFIFFDKLNSSAATYSPPSVWLAVGAIYLTLIGCQFLFAAVVLKIALAIHWNLQKISK